MYQPVTARQERRVTQALDQSHSARPEVSVMAPTLRGVLVPLDGSELAEQAIAVGAARARRTGATLHLVSVHQPLPLTAMPPDYPMPVPELEAEAREERVGYLETVAVSVCTCFCSCRIPRSTAPRKRSRLLGK